MAWEYEDICTQGIDWRQPRLHFGAARAGERGEALPRGVRHHLLAHRGPPPGPANPRRFAACLRLGLRRLLCRWRVGRQGRQERQRRLPAGRGGGRGAAAALHARRILGAAPRVRGCHADAQPAGGVPLGQGGPGRRGPGPAGEGRPPLALRLRALPPPQRSAQGHRGRPRRRRRRQRVLLGHLEPLARFASRGGLAAAAAGALGVAWGGL
mmetsp:Transcript_38175/g.103412  ORF Transcript_38175/g.103412 Transcript_38175/m.103412 type:complete len:211 (+) Transcript_38175:825-1457(+)